MPATRGLHLRREILDRACGVVRILSAIHRLESGSDVGTQLAIVAVFEKTQSFADNLTCGLVHARADLVTDQLFEFRRKGHVHTEQ